MVTSTLLLLLLRGADVVDDSRWSSGLVSRCVALDEARDQTAVQKVEGWEELVGEEDVEGEQGFAGFFWGVFKWIATRCYDVGVGEGGDEGGE